MLVFVTDAFAPWGMGSDRTTASLVDIYEALTRRPLAGGKRRFDRGEPGWRERIETVRSALFDAVAAGWLVCEPVARVVPIGVPPADDSVPVPAIAEPEVPELDWIEVLLVDARIGLLRMCDVASRRSTDRLSM
jgi:hypothetical protein